MVAPLGFGGSSDRTFEDEGMPVFDHPLYRFALFQFQGLREGSGTNEVKLAGPIGAFDELNFGDVAHKSMI
jgi:hypothetical protein